MRNSIDNLSFMPQITNAFSGWGKRITLKKISQVIVGGERITTMKQINFIGVIQPLSQEEIDSKAEGERSWEWLQIHAQTSRNDLDVGDLIEYNGYDYKVMALKDYSLNNYVEYHITKDYQS